MTPDDRVRGNVRALLNAVRTPSNADQAACCQTRAIYLLTVVQHLDVLIESAALELVQAPGLIEAREAANVASFEAIEQFLALDNYDQDCHHPDEVAAMMLRTMAVANNGTGPEFAAARADEPSARERREWHERRDIQRRSAIAYAIAREEHDATIGRMTLTENFPLPELQAPF